MNGLATPLSSAAPDAWYRSPTGFAITASWVLGIVERSSPGAGTCWAPSRASRPHLRRQFPRTIVIEWKR